MLILIIFARLIYFTHRMPLNKVAPVFIDLKLLLSGRSALSEPWLYDIVINSCCNMRPTQLSAIRDWSYKLRFLCISILK